MLSMDDQMSLRIRLAWGRRRESEKGPAPHLPTVEGDEEEYLRLKYPYLYVYNSREESLAEAALRARDKPVDTPFHPAHARKTAEA